MFKKIFCGIFILSILINIILGFWVSRDNGKIRGLENEVLALYTDLGDTTRNYISEYQKHRADTEEYERQLREASEQYTAGIRRERKYLERERIKLYERDRKLAEQGRILFNEFEKILSEKNLDK